MSAPGGRRAIAVGRARWAVVALASAHAGPARADDGTQQVQVLAPHRDVGETTARREDTRDLPGTFGDPTRVLETLPGVVPTASGLQAFFVRGAPPTSTGYFIDGVAVPVLYHVGFGPSVIHPALVDLVGFYQGAAPAGYGRAVGGVVAATTSSPADHPHAEANARLFDVGAIAETPFDDGRASALAAARYGYPGLVLPLFANGTGLSYWDYQARATLKVDDRDRIGAFVFGSYDRLTDVEQSPAGQKYTQQLSADEFHRVDLHWDRTLGSSATLRLAGTLGRDVVGDDVSNSIDDLVRLRAEIDARPWRDLRARAGADVQVDRLRPASPPSGAPAGPSLSPARDAVVVGAHADAAWRITRRVEVTPGLRVDVYSRTVRPASDAPVRPGSIGGSATAVLEPRLAARARVAPGVTAVSTFGVSHQLPGIVAQYPQATPFLGQGLLTDLQSSVQTSQGIELSLPLHVSLTSTLFLHDYAGLPDATACAYRYQDPRQCVTPTVSGRAFGLEVLVRRALSERLTVWISYTLSRSTRQARPPGGDEPTMTIVSEYDRTHVTSAVASYDLGRDWRIGGRVFAYSGRPYTDFSLSTPVIPYDSRRLPGFYRLDARLEKSWKLGAHDRIAVVIEGINVTLDKEAVSATCAGLPATSMKAASPGATSAANNACAIDTIGPITIPSIGLEGTFR